MSRVPYECRKSPDGGKAGPAEGRSPAGTASASASAALPAAGRRSIAARRTRRVRMPRTRGWVRDGALPDQRAARRGPVGLVRSWTYGAALPGQRSARLDPDGLVTGWTRAAVRCRARGLPGLIRTGSPIAAGRAVCPARPRVPGPRCLSDVREEIPPAQSGPRTLRRPLSTVLSGRSRRSGIPCPASERGQT